ncbi:unnamed protein product, partial [Pylaiella littoralis]
TLSQVASHAAIMCQTEVFRFQHPYSPSTIAASVQLRGLFPTGGAPWCGSCFTNSPSRAPPANAALVSGRKGLFRADPQGRYFGDLP